MDELVDVGIATRLYATGGDIEIKEILFNVDPYTRNFLVQVEALPDSVEFRVYLDQVDDSDKGGIVVLRDFVAGLLDVLNEAVPA